MLQKKQKGDCMITMSTELPKYKILMTDCIFQDQNIERRLLAEIGAELVLAPSKDEDTLVGLAHGVDGILVTYAELTAKVIKACTKCRIITRTGIGYNNIDVAAANECGIMVSNVPDYCIDEVADHTLALILAWLRKIPLLSASVKNGQWNINLARPIPRLNTLTAGLVGFGHIARAVSGRLKAFGVTVKAYDPYIADDMFTEADVERCLSLQSLAETADIISLHSPLTDETRNMINSDVFQKMKQTAILVNTSRGPLINESDLHNAIATGQIAGCCLDVMAMEPCDRNSPLLQYDNVIVTPHVAFYSEGSDIELRVKSTQQIILALTQGQPRYWVNKV
jgi:D-3-phosphoglycerate dehydrogenase